MEVVGQLVGLDPDEGRAHRVDREVEPVDVDVVEDARRVRAQPREGPGPEGPPAAHQVLPQPRLRLVDPEADRGAERAASLGRRQVLLVHAVAGLVQRPEERHGEAVAPVPGGDPHVARSDALRERVDRAVEPAAREVEAERPHHLDRERLLGRLGHGAREHGRGRAPGRCRAPRRAARRSRSAAARRPPPPAPRSNRARTDRAGRRTGRRRRGRPRARAAAPPSRAAPARRPPKSSSARACAHTACPRAAWRASRVTRSAGTRRARSISRRASRTRAASSPVSPAPSSRPRRSWSRSSTMCWCRNPASVADCRPRASTPPAGMYVCWSQPSRACTCSRSAMTPRRSRSSARSVGGSAMARTIPQGPAEARPGACLTPPNAW